MLAESLKIEVSLSKQKLYVFQADELLKTFQISSAEKGIGCEKNSFQTPIGKHKIRAKIGENQPINTVFVARRPTGEIYSPELKQANPNRDWILTRILWLSGCEPGKNRLGNVDTMQRFVYIHGTPDDEAIDKPLSHGCLRMRNQDIVELFAMIPVGTPIEIFADDASNKPTEPS